MATDLFDDVMKLLHVDHDKVDTYRTILKGGEMGSLPAKIAAADDSIKQQIREKISPIIEMTFGKGADFAINKKGVRAWDGVTSVENENGRIKVNNVAISEDLGLSGMVAVAAI